LHYNVTAGGTLGTPKVLTGGAPNLDFTLASGSTCTGAVTANSPCAVHVTFRPLASGVRNGTVEITDGSGNVLATTAISGFGGSPVAQLTPTYLPFGAVPVGSSETLPVTVTNGGEGTLTVAASISASSDYTIAGSTCGSGVTPGNSCTLQVEFTPTSISTTHDGLLTVQTNSGNATVGLAGTGSGLSVFGGFNGAPLEFGTINDGSTEVLPLTITNVGLPGTVTIGAAITVRSTTTPTTTYEVLNTTQNTCQAGIAAGQSCTLPVEFAPTTSGGHDDLLTLTPSPSAGAAATTLWLLGASVAAPGKSVIFAGLQTTLPINGPIAPTGVAVDRAGDVFVSDAAEASNRVVELQQTATGYGPQVNLATSDGPNSAFRAIAVDSAGDVFVADIGAGLVVEFPWTGTGYGPQTTLPFGATEGVAVDSAGDVFVAGGAEFPKTSTGYGPQITLPFSGLYYPSGIAVDSGGDAFEVDQGNGLAVELPKTPTGYGPQTTLATYDVFDPLGVAVDKAGDVFVTDPNNSLVVELSKTSTGYGPQTTLPANGLIHQQGVAVDSAGDVFIADTGTGRVVELQTQTSVYVCAPGQTIPSPCSVTQTLNFKVYADLTLGTPVVLTGGAPNLDFTLANGSTCTGALTENSACTVKVTFAPMATGVRNGTVEIVDGGGNVLTTAMISGTGVAPPAGSPVAQVSIDYLPFGPVPLGSSEAVPLFVTNSGGGTLTVATALSGSSSYTIAGSTCEGGVTPGDSCAVLVRFSPTSIATHDGVLTLQTNGGDLTVGLAGSSPAA